ncbi:hypothetical protein HDU76_008079 [Blyttiomyces sp. JEL0837]|nr:hypothetical protein HDU76_008079 [Blyttiomyces sp. JEL0837]
MLDMDIINMVPIWTFIARDRSPNRADRISRIQYFIPPDYEKITLEEGNGSETRKNKKWSRVRAAAAPSQVRMISASVVARRDIIQDLYLKNLREYKPPKDTGAEKVDLVEKFTIPPAPPAPEIESGLEAAVGEDVALEEAAWPALVNPIDQHGNYNDEWEFRCNPDDGSLLPRRLKEIDYEHDHH